MARARLLASKADIMAIKGAAPDRGRVTPHLIVRNTLQAVEFYKQALEAEVLYCSPLPDGTTAHAWMRCLPR